jgi:hypothetical protein
MSNPGIQIATVITLLFLSAEAAYADFCGDLKALFAQSTNIADLRGPAAGERSWTAKIGITRAENCKVTQFDDKGDLAINCIVTTISNKADADKEFDSLVAQIKKCAPKPAFNYNTNESESSKTFGFSDPVNHFSGLISIICFWRLCPMKERNRT